MLAEEEEYYFTDFFTPETIGFIIPSKGHAAHVILQILLSGLLCGYGVYYFLPSRMTRYAIFVGRQLDSAHYYSH
jgi:hypothetical protein